MSLTLGSGPLGTQPAGDFNFSLDGAPARRLYFEPYPRRVRALVGDRIVLDSVRGRLLHECELLPRLYFPLEDLDDSLLERTETSTHCPYKDEATYWHVQVDGRRIEDGAWSYETPLVEALEVARHVCFSGEGIEVEIAEPADRFTLAVPAAA